MSSTFHIHLLSQLLVVTPLYLYLVCDFESLGFMSKEIVELRDDNDNDFENEHNTVKSPLPLELQSTDEENWSSVASHGTTPIKISTSSGGSDIKHKRDFKMKAFASYPSSSLSMDETLYEVDERHGKYFQKSGLEAWSSDIVESDNLVQISFDDEEQQEQQEDQKRYKEVMARLLVEKKKEILSGLKSGGDL